MRATQQTTNNQGSHSRRVFAGRGLGDGEDCSIGLECANVEQDGEIGTDSVRNELVRDVWSVVAGFLKDDSMESPAGRRKDMCGILARRAWIPLKHREAVLMMHEIAVCVEKACRARWAWAAQIVTSVVPWARVSERVHDPCGQRC